MIGISRLATAFVDIKKSLEATKIRDHRFLLLSETHSNSIDPIFFKVLHIAAALASDGLPCNHVNVSA